MFTSSLTCFCFRTKRSITSALFPHSSAMWGNSLWPKTTSKHRPAVRWWEEKIPISWEQECQPRIHKSWFITFWLFDIAAENGRWTFDLTIKAGDSLPESMSKLGAPRVTTWYSFFWYSPNWTAVWAKWDPGLTLRGFLWNHSVNRSKMMKHEIYGFHGPAWF